MADKTLFADTCHSGADIPRATFWCRCLPARRITGPVQEGATNLFDMTRSVFGTKPQWYAAEVVVPHQREYGPAVLKECDGCQVDLWLCANGRWSCGIEVVILHPAQGWVPRKSFTRQQHEAVVDEAERCWARVSDTALVS